MRLIFMIFINLLHFKIMHPGKKSFVIKMLLMMVLLKTSQAEEEDTQWRSYMTNSSSDRIENPVLNVLFNELKDNEKDNYTIGKTSDKVPEFVDEAIPVNDSTGEVEAAADSPYDDTYNGSMVFTYQSLASVNGSMQGSLYASHVIYGRPKAQVLIVREFHECISCSIDDGPKKHYNQCLRKLSPENQEIAKTCCNTLYDSEFCSKAFLGMIDYETICKDPIKALNVAYCFWQKIGDQGTEDIKEYSECKRQLLDRYCTVESNKEYDRAMENEKLY